MARSVCEVSPVRTAARICGAWEPCEIICALIPASG
jgi:hypothetical protein